MAQHEDDISEVSITSSSMEVTHEEYLRNTRKAKIDPNTPTMRSNTSNISRGSSSNNNNSGGVRRFKSILGGSRQPNSSAGKRQILPMSADLISVGSESRSLISNPMTVGSLDTIKASNRTGKAEQEQKKDKKPWNKLKRIIGVVKTSSHHHSGTAAGSSASSVDGVASGNRQRSLTEESGQSNTSSNPFKIKGRRVRSSPDKKSSAANQQQQARQEQEMNDDTIRGRFDGIDALFLGDVQLRPPSTAADVSSTDEIGPYDELPPWDRTWECTFTGKPVQSTPAEIVVRSVWASAGRDPPEIILDSFCPGPNGRWSVRVLKQTDDSLVKEKNKPSAERAESKGTTSSYSWWGFDAALLPPLQPARSHDSISDDGDAISPIATLRNMLWGETNTPSNNPVARVNTDDDGGGGGTSASHHSDNDDPMHDVAARCSIPIDIDDDTFIITTREHIHALHDVASVSLVRGNFQDALRIFDAMLNGLGCMTDPDLRFTKGATLHNMGMLQLWMGQPESALPTFNKALDERLQQYPPKHPDIAVTLSRKSAACFALGKYEEAIAALKHALEILPLDHRSRAKLLNNLGVIYAFQKDSGGALREFTSALDIQRKWLDVPVRRETTVYDAAVTLSNMGKVHFETSDDELALNVYEEALLLLTTFFRKDHDFVLAMLRSLAIAKAQTGQYGNALLILQGCLRSQNSRFGVLSSASMETVGLSSYIHARNGDLEDALKCLLTVRKWQEANLDENHTALLKSKMCQKALEAKIGKNRGFGMTKIWI